MSGKKPVDPSAANVCYSFITDKEAISVSAVYRVTDGAIAAVPNAGGLSPDLSELEGRYGRAWIENIKAEMST
jgi:sulfide dehydrogenase [flavocytochrome c] flavoprotein subunit